MGGASALSAGVVAIIITVVIANLGNNIVAPLMPAIKEQFGSSAAEVGLVVSGFGLGRLVMDLPAGHLTDRVSASKMFAAGIILSGGTAALAASSTTLDQLIIFRTAMGFGSSIMSTVALVLLARMVAPSQRGNALAFYFSAMLFGQALSPTIGGYLATAFGWRAAFVFCALTPFISFPLNLVATSGAGSDPSTGAAKRAAQLSKQPDAASSSDTAPRANWPALASVYFSTFVNFFDRQGMRGSLLPLYAGTVLGLDPGTIGATLTIGSILTIAINLPSGTLADRVGRKLLLIPGMLTLCFGNLALLAGDSQLVFTLSTVLISMGVLANSMQSGLVADLVPERLVGRGMGMYRFTADLGVVIGPLMLGVLVDRFGFAAASIAGAIVVLSGVVAITALVPRKTAGTVQPTS